MKSENKSMQSFPLFGSVLIMFLFALASVSPASYAASNVTCPVGLVSGMTLTTEFGQAVADNTRCVHRRHNVKTMFVIDNFESSPGHVFALHQMNNVWNDYTITAGMKPGRDFTMIAVVHSKGGMLLLNDSNVNPYRQMVVDLMNKGVTFYLCENTVRGMIAGGLLQQGNVAAGIIPGVKYVTAGLAAMGDFESEGYSVVFP